MKIIHIFQFFQLVIVILIIDSTSANLPEPSILEYRLDKVSFPYDQQKFLLGKIFLEADKFHVFISLSFNTGE